MIAEFAAFFFLIILEGKHGFNRAWLASEVAWPNWGWLPLDPQMAHISSGNTIGGQGSQNTRSTVMALNTYKRDYNACN